MMKLLSNLFGLAMEAIGLRRENAQRENTPEMQAAAKAKQDAAVVDQSREAAAKADLEEIRRRSS